MILTVFFNYNGTLKFKKKSKIFSAFYSNAVLEVLNIGEGMFALSTEIIKMAAKI